MKCLPAQRTAKAMLLTELRRAARPAINAALKLLH
jgi:hypothetical protein